eukprot:1152030-Pelagomonas_calceolata.AAC.6
MEGMDRDHAENAPPNSENAPVIQPCIMATTSQRFWTMEWTGVPLRESHMAYVSKEGANGCAGLGREAVLRFQLQ